MIPPEFSLGLFDWYGTIWYNHVPFGLYNIQWLYHLVMHCRLLKTNSQMMKL